jgi:ribulose kinase
MGAAVRAAVSAAVSNGADASSIAALCVDTTCCSVVALDASGAPLRPCLLWMDMRSAAQAEQVAACGDAALCVNGGGAGPVSAEWMIPKALWLKTHERHTFDAATYICEYQVRAACECAERNGKQRPLARSLGVLHSAVCALRVACRLTRRAACAFPMSTQRITSTSS